MDVFLRHKGLNHTCLLPLSLGGGAMLQKLIFASLAVPGGICFEADTPLSKSTV